MGSNLTKETSTTRTIWFPDGGTKPFHVTIANDPSSISMFIDYPPCFELFLRDRFAEFKRFAHSLFGMWNTRTVFKIRCELVGREHPTNNPNHAVNRLEDLYLIVYWIIIDGEFKELPFNGFTQHVISIESCDVMYEYLDFDKDDPYEPINDRIVSAVRCCPIALHIANIIGPGSGFTWYTYEELKDMR